MKIRFFNARIIDLDNPNGWFWGEVHTDGKSGLITYVGPELFDNLTSFDRQIDCKKNIVMPAFVNAHTHSAMTLFRGIKDNANLQEWLFDNILPLEHNLTPQDVYWASRLACLEYAAGGVATIDDMYFKFPSQTAAAVKQHGLRARIAVLNPNDDECKKLLEMSKSNKNITLCSNIHSIYAAEEKDIEACINFAVKHKLPLATHLSETLQEVGECIAKNKQTPPEYLESFGFLDRKSSLYHCVHVDKDDAAILANADATIVTCPASNLKLASGIAPLITFKNKNINIAIGTDGAASNNNLDMFKEMFLAATLSGCAVGNNSTITAKDVVFWATRGGAISLGIDNLGCIKKGWLADIAIVDLSAPHANPQNDIISHLVYSAKSCDVVLTMCDGKIIYENGKYKSDIDANEIIQNCQMAIDKLKESL